MSNTSRSHRTAKIAATPQVVVSIMVSMDDAARQRFLERANQAAERKEKERQENKVRQWLQQRQVNQQLALKRQQQRKSISYWLFSASLAEIFKKIVIGH